MRTPVAFFLFNRPDLTERVFAEIAKARPPVLLLIADGPRADRPDEPARCAATRAIVERIDWDCRVLRNYAPANMGCGRRQSSGMMWIFEQIEEAIILEDDTFPDPSFFPFCEEMLARYRHDERVMHISGDNWLFGRGTVPDSYFFSRYCLSWGWASWRRAFRFYDPAIPLWPAVRETDWLDNLLLDPRAVDHWRQIFDLTHASIDNVDTWDYQWLLTIWLQNGLCALPDRNLISNLGFNRADAAHLTGGADDPRNSLATLEMPLPLRHPESMVWRRDLDQQMFDVCIRPRRRPYDVVREACVGSLPTPVRRSLSSLKAALRSAPQETTG